MLCPVECWTSPRMEITLLLWAPVQCLSSLMVKKFLRESWLEFSTSQFMCIASPSLTMHFWEESGSMHLRICFPLECTLDLLVRQWFPWLGIHVWSQCPKCSLNGEEFHWLAMFFLRQLSTTLFAAKPCYRPMLNFLSTKTPRSFSTKLLFSQISSASSVASRYKILHLSNFMRFL